MVIKFVIAFCIGCIGFFLLWLELVTRVRHVRLRGFDINFSDGAANDNPQPAPRALRPKASTAKRSLGKPKAKPRLKRAA